MKERFKQVCSATETGEKIEIVRVASGVIIPKLNNKATDQTAQLHRLLRDFVVCIQQSGFLASRPTVYFEGLMED